jgi:hypothetical protein
MRIPVAVFLLLGIGAAIAQTPPNATLQRVTPDGASVACIGKADTAPCATATFFACAVRRTAEICAAVGLAEPPRLFDGSVAVEWVFDRASIIRERDVTEDLQHFAWFKAGNTLVEAQVRHCAPETVDCAAEDWVDWQVYLAPVEGGRFAVVGWRGDNEAEGPTEIPDAFQPSQAPEPAQ